VRKHQWRQILDLLKTIKEAQSAGLYGDCQEDALSICDFIENIEGKGAEIVALLIEYCEFLFKASNGEINDKFLSKHFLKIENSITHELKPNRIEMVFLSYKAAMSDSLESIYLAAKEDPDCDAYWIPIPYSELKAGGTVDKWSMRVRSFTRTISNVRIGGSMISKSAVPMRYLRLLRMTLTTM
jgi:hypothetical protein